MNFALAIVLVLLAFWWICEHTDWPDPDQDGDQ